MTATLEQAQQSLLDLVARTARGERVIITQGDRPMAELRPVAPPAHASVRQLPGHAHGRVQGRRALGRLRRAHGVRVLLDTHAELCFVLGDLAISRVARGLIEDPPYIVGPFHG